MALRVDTFPSLIRLDHYSIFFLYTFFYLHFYCIKSIDIERLLVTCECSDGFFRIPIDGYIYIYMYIIHMFLLDRSKTTPDSGYKFLSE